MFTEHSEVITRILELSSIGGPHSSAERRLGAIKSHVSTEMKHFLIFQIKYFFSDMIVSLRKIDSASNSCILQTHHHCPFILLYLFSLWKVMMLTFFLSWQSFELSVYYLPVDQLTFLTWRTFSLSLLFRVLVHGCCHLCRPWLRCLGFGCRAREDHFIYLIYLQMFTTCGA